MRVSSPSSLGSSAIRVNSLWTRRPGVLPRLGAAAEGEFARLLSGALEGEKLYLHPLDRGAPGRLPLGDGAGDLAEAPESALELEAVLERRGLGRGVHLVALVEEQGREDSALDVAGEVRHQGLRGGLGAGPKRGEDGAQPGVREVGVLDDREQGRARARDGQKQEEQLALGQRHARRRAGGRGGG